MADCIRSQISILYLNGCIYDSQNHIGGIHLGSSDLPSGLLVAVLVQSVCCS